MSGGIDKVWQRLGEQSPEDVCRRAVAVFDRSAQAYTLRCFGRDVVVCPNQRTLGGQSAATALLLGKLRYFSELAILWYLVGAQDTPLSGRLVRPSDLKAGRIFTQGSHVLPLNKLAERYGQNLDAFLEKGRELSAERLSFGDAAVRLWPFPRVPLTVLVWKGSDEFAARADMLFDASCEAHLPQDVLWSTAMLGALAML